MQRADSRLLNLSAIDLFIFLMAAKMTVGEASSCPVAMATSDPSRFPPSFSVFLFLVDLQFILTSFRSASNSRDFQRYFLCLSRLVWVVYVRFNTKAERSNTRHVYSVPHTGSRPRNTMCFSCNSVNDRVCVLVENIFQIWGNLVYLETYRSIFVVVSVQSGCKTDFFAVGRTVRRVLKK